MEKQAAIRVDHLTKMYKLYDRISDRLRDSLGLTRKKCYREHYALTDISFSVDRGETIGIIGTNGAGKSTILKIITGVLSPTSGSVTVDGRISALLELGAGFNMEYTGIENIYLNGTMLGYTDAEMDARLQGILDFADIGDYVYQPVKTYSSGMFVRLAFAVAINIDPEILIVDEALSVGDAFFQAKCYRKFEDFKKEGKTILFVSHDLSSISKYCDRVILLDHGKLAGNGSPKDMVDLYKRLLVHQGPDPSAELLRKTGDGSMNLAAGLAEDGCGNDGSSDSENGSGWIGAMQMNPGALEYGDRRAEMLAFSVLDQRGLPTTTIEKGSLFTIKVKVRFHEDIDEPIFAFTIKDMRGTEITGTNTMFEKTEILPRKKGETDIVSYTQRADLQGGEYLISFGLTGYQGGEFVVYHRLYDACSLTIVSVKNTVGFYDMNSEITVERENAREG
ncbi:MAG: ABC transporter ATP-binding protein [Lachnospiraceae bacterium]|nr:ABC transporter ATP-binding protein [Lachnospiraceae bacterium]